MVIHHEDGLLLYLPALAIWHVVIHLLIRYRKDTANHRSLRNVSAVTSRVPPIMPAR